MGEIPTLSPHRPPPHCCRCLPPHRRRRRDPDPWKKSRVWLGTFDSTEDVARAYDATAVALCGPKAKTNFTLVGATTHFPFYRPSPAPPPPPLRPASSSHSSTIESFADPCQPTIAPNPNSNLNPNLYPSFKLALSRWPLDGAEDLHSDCGSSSSVVDDGDGGVSSLPLPFDLNMLPPMTISMLPSSGCDGDYYWIWN